MLAKILTAPTESLGRASRFAIMQLKLWSHCARLLQKNHAGRQAAALSYHTIFGIVPLAILMVLIFQLFPTYSDTGKKVRDLVYEELNLSTIVYPSQTSEETEEPIMLTDYFDGIVDGFFGGINKGTVTIFSGIIVIWAALALLSTIERAFNSIWHVVRGRGLLNRIINYWALLTLGPLLLGVAVFITTKSATLGRIQQTLLANFAPAFLSYLVSTVAFFLLYFVLPNTKVKAASALWGAAVAALVWSLAKYAFSMYVTKYIPYNEVYGVLGLMPLCVFWIYITWLIVLFGLQLTFTTQHLRTLDAAEIAAARKSEDYFIANDLTIINIVRQVAAAFEANKAPVSSEVICTKLNLPAEFSEKILDHLVDCGILLQTSEPKAGFIPATDPANTKLSDISRAVSSIEFGQSCALPPDLRRINQSQQEALSQFTLKQILPNPQENPNPS